MSWSVFRCDGTIDIAIGHMYYATTQVMWVDWPGWRTVNAIPMIWKWDERMINWQVVHFGSIGFGCGFAGLHSRLTKLAAREKSFPTETLIDIVYIAMQIIEFRWMDVKLFGKTCNLCDKRRKCWQSVQAVKSHSKEQIRNNLHFMRENSTTFISSIETISMAVKGAMPSRVTRNSFELKLMQVENVSLKRRVHQMFCELHLLASILTSRHLHQTFQKQKYFFLVVLVLED